MLNLNDFPPESEAKVHAFDGIKFVTAKLSGFHWEAREVQSGMTMLRGYASTRAEAVANARQKIKTHGGGAATKKIIALHLKGDHDKAYAYSKKVLVSETLIQENRRPNETHQL